MEAVIKIGGEKGVNNISTLKVAKLAKCSEASIFKYFSSKKELLASAFLFIDKKIQEDLTPEIMKTSELSDFINKASDLWSLYFSWMINHPSYTKYYAQYRLDSRFDPKLYEKESDVYVQFAKTIVETNEYYHLFAKVSSKVFWTLALDNTLLFALRICEGKIENNEKNIASVKTIIMSGIISLFNADTTSARKVD